MGLLIAARGPADSGAGTRLGDVSQRGCQPSHINEAAAAPSRTATSTVEALLYELPSGLSCLSDEGARNRLRSCDQAAIRTIAAELLSWKSKNKPWLPPWSEDDVAKLLAVKEGLK
jgi:hypothetical protein